MNTPRSLALERLTYTLAAPALAVVPNIAPHSSANGVLWAAGIAGAIGGGGALFTNNTRWTMRLSPLAASLVVEVVATATHSEGWSAGVAALWLAGGWIIHPLSGLSRRGFRPSRARRPAPIPAAPEPAPEPIAAPAPEHEPTPKPTITYADEYTREVGETVWEKAGSPANTIVEFAVRHPGMPHDLTMLLRAAEPGRPITGLTEEAVAAAFHVDPTEVEIYDVLRQAGRPGGPGWKEVRVTPDAAELRRTNPTPAQRWEDNIAADRGGAPGSVLVDTGRDEKRKMRFWRAKMAHPTALPKVDLAKVCRALNVYYDDSCVFLLADGDEFLITVFDEPPLSRIFPATRDLLKPDAKGMYVCGYSVTGQPVKNMIFQHDKNAPCHGLILGVSRSGKTQYFAIAMSAESQGSLPDGSDGAVIWLASYIADEKTSTLGRYIDRQGSSALYMLRMLRAARALCEIRAEMPWDFDGQPHDYKPGDPRSPYRPLNVYCDEFMQSSTHPVYGEEIQALGDDLTVMGLKYGVGFKVAGQSPFAHNGFSTEMKDNLKQNSRAVVFNMGSPGANRKALEGAMENAFEAPTIPTRYARNEGSAIDRAISGEAAPENGVSTGGVAVIILDGGKAALIRTLYADFDSDLSELFPDEVIGLTPHEIRELDKRGLWGDWNRPDEDAEAKASGKDKLGGPAEDAVTDPRKALELIKSLTRT